MPYVTPNTLNKVVLARGRQSQQLQSESIVIAASQTIKVGDVLKKSSGANTFEQALALPGSNNAVTASGGSGVFAYVAAENITTDASGVDAGNGPNKNTIQGYRCGPQTEFGFRLYNATASDAELADIALGTAYILGRWRGASSSEWWYVVTTTTTNGEFEYIEPYGGSGLSDDYGVLWGQFIAASCLFG